MAITYPDIFPQINSHLGEAKVFEVLKNHLSDAWMVYANVRFHQSSPFGLADIETDFIVSHPLHGVCIFEVKGGIHIRFDPLSQAWYSTNQHMDSFMIKNPYEQARKNKYALLELLKQSRLKSLQESDLNDRLRVAYGVIFADVSMMSGHLPGEGRKEITLFSHHLNSDIEKNIIKVMMNTNTQQECDLNGLMHSIVNEKFAPICEIRRSLKNWIHDEGKSMLTLTQQQFQLLSALQFYDEASIYGCAGSGKTLMAVEKAIMESKKGKKVLLLCFNTLLGQQLNNLFIDNDLVDAHCFHHIIASHYDIEDESILFNDSFLLEIAYNDPKGIYDGFVMDEAQDFSAERMMIIDALLKEKAFKYYFWDDHQNINFNETAIPNHLKPLVLSTNYRNTQKIFNSIMKHVDKQLPLEAMGPIGRDIELELPYPKGDTTSLLKRLQDKIHYLIHHEGLEPKDIAILSFKGKHNSCLTSIKTSIPVILFEDRMDSKAIKIDTVRRFKGLEASVVILVELDDEKAMNDEKHFNDMCYVAFSRAVHHCVVFPVEGVKVKI